jgi:alpha-glucosidase (family GH31 glycosyl hydrolase)
MIPRWALGNWWSRYWAYSSAELINLTREFKENQVPLSVCIVDMDWHLTETNNTCTGWTGYTWNRKLFPDPDGFLQAIHRLGLKTALNLHPAEGIHPHEEQYGAFAEYMGIDPITEDPILFDSTDPQFMCGYFELLHHPLEAQGVDFWWLDWQQGTQTKQRGLDPLWWLNHLHFYDLGRDRVRRPFIFSRWGGLGNHRYPIGFSGDTVVGWEALDFQPGFTATAANVGYGWWSHDIGGHMRGIEDDELFIRWVQYGVFSPILRLHSTNNPFHERRPWGRGMLAEKLVGSALRFRHRLIPYLYSMAWRNSQTGLPLITPLYYTHPEHEDAYQCPQAYWFGSELIAAPFTLPADADTHLSRQIVWLPEISGVEASCFDFYSGERLKSGWRTIYGSLEDIPVFARPGAIIPLGPVTGEFGTPNPESLNLHIFPGADNLFELYEDDGETIDYQKGCYAITPFTEKWSGHTLEFRIGPVRGDLSLVPPIRTFELSLHCLRQPDRVDINLNGSSMNLDLHYDEERAILILDPFQLQPNDELIVRCSIVRGLLRADRNHTIQKLNRYIKAFHLNTQTKAMILQDWSEIASGRLSLRNLRGLTESQIIALESLFD